MKHALLFAGLLAGVSVSVPAAQLERRALADEPASELVLVLPARPLDLLEVDVRLDGRTRRLLLRRHSLRDPAARVFVHHADGTTSEHEPPAVRTYRGVLAGDPGSVVLASLTDAGLRADVRTGAGERFTLEPAGARGRHRVVSGAPAGGDRPACGVTPHTFAPVEPLPDTLPLVVQPVDPACLRRCEVAFDADFEYFQAKGSSVANVVAAIDAIMNQVEHYFARDVQITYAVTAYVVRTAPFYAPTGGGSLLDLFRNEWTSTQAAVPRDVAHLMTGKPGSLIEYGGLAYVGVVCNFSFGYGWSMDGANIVGHELGHNWNAGHCHDTTPCNNMCGACFYVGPRTRDIILAYRNSRTCLDDVPFYAAPLAPYAAPDDVYLLKDELEDGPFLVDVLANDADGNCGLFFLESFDAVSDRGGTLARVADAPLVPDRLAYTPPAAPFVGTDTFRYRAGDGRLSTEGTVTVEVDAHSLRGAWRLDEAAGTDVADATAHRLDGTTVGAPVWTAGEHGGALELDGVDDSVVLPPLGLDTNRATITAWVRRDGPQVPFAGLVFSRDGSTVAGLHLGSANELRYTWNDAASTHSWNSGLVLPDQQWVFVALVVEPDRARLFLDGGFVTNTVTHAPEAFDGETRLGLDDAGAGRHFRGRLDEVRVYDHALTSGEIALLWILGGRAEAPFPDDGGRLADPAAALTWMPALGAVAHDVYLGTDPDAVRDAGPGAPEHQGTFAGTSFTPAGLTEGVTWYWRVDTQTGFGSQPGRVWQFDLARRHRWPLDEPSGLTAADVEGGADGTYFGGVLLDRPGATASLGRAVELDGVNDRVALPPLDLDTDALTITCWLKRDGVQNDWAGLVFSRDGTTVAGLNLGTDEELRYHWNAASATWGWDSGLVVPDGVWVFAALVVEPTRATIHLGQGGVLDSAVNPVSHSAEAFDGATLLGRDALSSARSFDGCLDDVRIWDAALTPAEVEALYVGSL